MQQSNPSQLCFKVLIVFSGRTFFRCRELFEIWQILGKPSWQLHDAIEHLCVGADDIGCSHDTVGCCDGIQGEPIG